MASAPPELPVEGPPPLQKPQRLIEETIPYTYTDAAVFYALLYLDVASSATVEFDLKQHTRTVASGHFWYGITQGWSEAANAVERADFAYPSPDDAPSYPGVSHPDFMGISLEKAIQRHPSYDEDSDLGTSLPGDEEARAEIRATLKRGFEGFTDERHADRLAAFFTHLNHAGTVTLAATVSDVATYTDLFTASSDPLDVQTDPVDSARTLEIFFTMMNWTRSYGGDAWAGLMQHLQRIADDDISLRAWLDTSFGIEHNGQGWLDKEGFDLSQYRTAEDVTGLSTKNREWVLIRRLEDLLDSNQEGDMEPIFEVADRAQQRTFPHDRYDSIGVPFGRYLRQIKRGQL